MIYFFWLAPKNRGDKEGYYIIFDIVTSIMLLPHLFGYYAWYIMLSAYKTMKEENQTNYQLCNIEMTVDPESSQCMACGSNIETD